jgi:hypothetical protein
MIFRKPWCWLVVVFSMGVASTARAQALPPLTPAEGIGVNFHSTRPGTGELEMIKAAGFRWVREDLFWATTETVKGQYDFSAYDRLLKMLDAQHLRVVFILDYGNPHYADPGDKQPFISRVGTEEFRTAFAAWAAAAVSHFAGRGCIWEMWNEPNYKLFWAPTPDVSQYIALASAADAAIHRAAPGEPIMGPATSTIAFDFIERCCQAGLLNDWAAVSVHPYRQTDPATVIEDYARLRDIIAKYAPPGRTIPIVCSEWGYSTAWKGIDETKQAAYLRGVFKVNIAAGIPLTIWYDWRDDGVNPADPECHFGLVHRQYFTGRNPVYDTKPAYAAARATTEEIAGGQK